MTTTLPRLPVGVLLTSVLIGVSCAVLTFLTLDALKTGGGWYDMVPLSFQNTEDTTRKFNNTPLSEKYRALLQEVAAAGQLQEEVQVLVWVMTQPPNHATKAVAVKETWGKRVSKLLFMSTEYDPDLPTVKLNTTEGRDFLWGKTKAAFQHCYDEHLNSSHWFMKVDDDTFVVVENLRYMLSLYDPETPIYFGSRFKPFTKQGYMSGGGGYVLSRAALRLFVERGLTDKRLCRVGDSKGAEDAEMGKCLDKLGVLAGDSRDSSGRGRFFPFIPEHHLIPGRIGKKSWYWDYIYYPIKEGSECCSNTAVTFHYISPTKMRELNYFLYHLRPFGVIPLERFPPALPPDRSSVPDEVLRRFSRNITR